MLPALSTLRSSLLVLGAHATRTSAGAAMSLQHAAYAASSSSTDIVRAEWGVYKGKGCCRFRLISPTWSASKSAKGNAFLVVEKEGVMLLEGAAVAAVKVGAGARSYNWEQKFTFALKAQELGALLMQGPGAKVDFYHDPNLNTPHAGAVRKSLNVMCNQDGSRLFSLNHSEAGGKLSFSVPMTVGEFCSFKVLANAAIPHLLGFDRAMQNAVASE